MKYPQCFGMFPASYDEIAIADQEQRAVFDLGYVTLSSGCYEAFSSYDLAGDM